jgi:NTE family protein
VRALVLSGGGARGAYEAGVASVLLEREQFDVVCGTSIGAINAALAAQGGAPLLRELWGAVPARRLIRGIPPIEAWRAVFAGRLRTLAHAFAGLPELVLPARLRKLRSVLDPEPIRAVLEELLDPAQLQCSLVVTATNLTMHRSEAFYRFVGEDAAERAQAFAAAEPFSTELEVENYRRAILASASIPLAYPAVAMRLRGRDDVYVDGGVGNNTPLRQAIDAGADDVTIVLADNVGLRDTSLPLDDLAAIGLASQDLLQERVLELDLQLARTINEAVLHGVAPGKRFVRLRTIGPSVPVALSMLSFADAKAVAAAFEQGYADGNHAIGCIALDALLANDPNGMTFEDGATIFSAEDAGDRLYVVVAGAVVLRDRRGERARLGPGDIFGATAFLGGTARRHDALAVGHTRVVPVDRARFEYLVRFAPHFALDVMRSFSVHVRDLDKGTDGQPSTMEGAAPQ